MLAPEYEVNKHEWNNSKRLLSIFSIDRAAYLVLRRSGRVDLHGRLVSAHARRWRAHVGIAHDTRRKTLLVQVDVGSAFSFKSYKNKLACKVEKKWTNKNLWQANNETIWQKKTHSNIKLNIDKGAPMIKIKTPIIVINSSQAKSIP
jgi:hypothetical protein